MAKRDSCSEPVAKKLPAEFSVGACGVSGATPVTWKAFSGRRAFPRRTHEGKGFTYEPDLRFLRPSRIRHRRQLRDGTDHRTGLRRSLDMAYNNAGIQSP